VSGLAARHVDDTESGGEPLSWKNKKVAAPNSVAADGCELTPRQSHQTRLRLTSKPPSKPKPRRVSGQNHLNDFGQQAAGWAKKDRSLALALWNIFITRDKRATLPSFKKPHSFIASHR